MCFPHLFSLSSTSWGSFPACQHSNMGWTQGTELRIRDLDPRDSPSCSMVVTSTLHNRPRGPHCPHCFKALHPPHFWCQSLKDRQHQLWLTASTMKAAIFWEGCSHTLFQQINWNRGEMGHNGGREKVGSRLVPLRLSPSVLGNSFQHDQSYLYSLAFSCFFSVISNSVY